MKKMPPTIEEADLLVDLCQAQSNLISVIQPSIRYSELPEAIRIQIAERFVALGDVLERAKKAGVVTEIWPAR